jgi:hypothetical protein
VVCYTPIKPKSGADGSTGRPSSACTQKSQLIACAGRSSMQVLQSATAYCVVGDRGQQGEFETEPEESPWQRPCPRPLSPRHTSGPGTCPGWGTTCSDSTKQALDMVLGIYSSGSSCICVLAMPFRVVCFAGVRRLTGGHSLGGVHAVDDALHAASSPAPPAWHPACLPTSCVSKSARHPRPATRCQCAWRQSASPDDVIQLDALAGAVGHLRSIVWRHCQQLVRCEDCGLCHNLSIDGCNRLGPACNAVSCFIHMLLSVCLVDFQPSASSAYRT